VIGFGRNFGLGSRTVSGGMSTERVELRVAVVYIVLALGSAGFCSAPSTLPMRRVVVIGSMARKLT